MLDTICDAHGGSAASPTAAAAATASISASVLAVAIPDDVCSRDHECCSASRFSEIIKNDIGHP